jgi:hypothetical protein
MVDTADSLRLRRIAAAAFHDHVLPAIRRHLPDVEGQITVLITSSVAYGTADNHSDLDVFIVFRTERDYRLHAKALGTVIDGLRLDDIYGNVCDKGVRFELESLPRSDLSRLYYHPENVDNWFRQTEWLLRWFIESVPIHDPAGVHERLSRVAGRWPEPVRREKQRATETRVASWSSHAARLLLHEGCTFPALRAAGRAISAGLEAAYVAADAYAPHPKWRHARARHLLGDHPAGAVILDAADRPTALLTGVSGEPQTLACALNEYSAELVAPEHQVAGRAWESLNSHADAYAVPTGRIWVARNRVTDEAFHAGAREATEQGEVVYLAEELGADFLPLGDHTYDSAMRVADSLRWLAGQTPVLGGAVERRRWLYINFVIWRKLRVVAKAEQRGLHFTRFWYQLQVIDHLVESLARLHCGFAPPSSAWSPETLPFLEREWLDLLLTPRFSAFLKDVEGFVTWAWKEFASIQADLVRRALLPQRAVDDPLATQWEVQYWKYENLFA